MPRDAKFNHDFLVNHIYHLWASEVSPSFPLGKSHMWTLNFTHHLFLVHDDHA